MINLRHKLKTLTQEARVITIDWIVLSAAIVVLGLGLFHVVLPPFHQGLTLLTHNINAATGFVLGLD